MTAQQVPTVQPVQVLARRMRRDPVGTLPTETLTGSYASWGSALPGANGSKTNVLGAAPADLLAELEATTYALALEDAPSQPGLPANPATRKRRPTPKQKFGRSLCQQCFRGPVDIAARSWSADATGQWRNPQILLFNS